jgi:hypothetical protein
MIFKKAKEEEKTGTDKEVKRGSPWNSCGEF